MANGATRWLRMHRHDVEAWSHMPAYIERVRKAGRDFDIANIDELCTRIEAAFVLPIDTIMGWIAVTDANKIVGHLVACEDVLSGRKVGWIIQAVSDGPRAVSRALCREVLADIERWAHALGYADLAMMTSRRETRAWERSYQFTVARLLMMRPMKGEG